MTATFLIINADDFGRSGGVNRGIITAHERGIVTSTTLMVRWPAALEAGAYAGASRSLAVGLHLDLGEWTYVDGDWHAEYDVVDTSDPEAVRTEIMQQLLRFGELVGRGPTHLDSHQHVHREEPVLSILTAIARDLDIPLRDVSSTVRYRGDFYGQTRTGEAHHEAITLGAFERFVAELSEGWTEMGCHPGESVDETDSTYFIERPMELEVLCDARAAEALARNGVQLVSFADYPS